MNFRNSDGSAFVVLLIVTSTIGLILLAVTPIVSVIPTKLGTQLHSLDSRITATSSALRYIASISNPSPSKCSTTEAKRGAITTARESCFISATDIDGIPKRMRLDYSAIFGELRSPITDEVMSCDSALQILPPLADSPIVANTNCTATQPIVTSHFSVNANLSSNQMVAVVYDGVKPALLGSTGKLEVSSQLKVSGHVIIIAGGDMIIHALQIDSAIPSDVLLISATGMITISEIIGAGRLSTLSTNPALLPPNTLPPSEITVPMLDRFVITVHRPESPGT